MCCVTSMIIKNQILECNFCALAMRPTKINYCALDYNYILNISLIMHYNLRTHIPSFFAISVNIASSLFFITFKNPSNFTGSLLLRLGIMILSRRCSILLVSSPKFPIYIFSCLVMTFLVYKLPRIELIGRFANSA